MGCSTAIGNNCWKLPSTWDCGMARGSLLPSGNSPYWRFDKSPRKHRDWKSQGYVLALHFDDDGFLPQRFIKTISPPFLVVMRFESRACQTLGVTARPRGTVEWRADSPPSPRGIPALVVLLLFGRRSVWGLWRILVPQRILDEKPEKCGCMRDVLEKLSAPNHAMSLQLRFVIPRDLLVHMHSTTRFWSEVGAIHPPNFEHNSDSWFLNWSS